MSKIPFEKIVYTPSDGNYFAPDGRLIVCACVYKLFGITIYQTYGSTVDNFYCK